MQVNNEIIPLYDAIAILNHVVDIEFHSRLYMFWVQVPFPLPRGGLSFSEHFNQSEPFQSDAQPCDQVHSKPRPNCHPKR
jgi:hypothetical protein